MNEAKPIVSGNDATPWGRNDPSVRDYMGEALACMSCPTPESCEPSAGSVPVCPREEQPRTCVLCGVRPSKYPLPAMAVCELRETLERR